MNPLLKTDFYKIHHNRMYPEGMTKLYSNFTPRKSRIKGVNEVVVFGIQHFILEYLIKKFNTDFWAKTEDGRELFGYEDQDYKYKNKIISEYKRHCNVDTSHIEALWDLGYLPIEIKALEEGTLCPIGVPMLTITNTHPDFGWLVNYLETLISCSLWQPITSATIAYQYKKLLDKYALETTGTTEGVQWQGHDFSMRGMSSVESSILSGMGHLLSFTGTDTIPAIYQLEDSYRAEGLIGASVPATEHSVMCMGTKEAEVDTFRRLMKLYPTGILSVVSDTWNLWDVLTKFLPELKDEIMSRDGKLVIRPDSGDPVDIICGVNIISYKTLDEAKEDFSDDLYSNQVHGESKFTIETKRIVKVEELYYELEENAEWNRYDKQYYFIEEMEIESKQIDFKPSYKGVIELLWDVFGGTVNSQGYKVLDPHIGAIYGDSITPERAEQILERLKVKGFASTNIVLGIGSFTYQYNTRDTLGFAMKATYGEVDGIGREIFKDPITDDGTKKSKKGLLQVIQTENPHVKENGQIWVKDQCTWEQEKRGLLQTVFLNGKLVKETTLKEIRERLYEKH